ncbi:MAG: hypothetical protein J7576_07380 [Siphonobacter aquaeclarae]|nr:hypothetical protein [Siphonobacter aquaeclarae]
MGLLSFLFGKKKGGAVAGLIRSHASGGSVLSLGPAESWSDVPERSYGNWVAVDRSFRDRDVSKQVRTVRQSVDSYVPEQSFSLVILENTDPDELPDLLHRFESALAPGGAFMVSLSDSRQARKAWEALGRRYRTLDETENGDTVTRLLSL